MTNCLNRGSVCNVENDAVGDLFAEMPPLEQQPVPPIQHQPGSMSSQGTSQPPASGRDLRPRRPRPSNLQAGIDEGNAIFEITAPSWKGFDAERMTAVPSLTAQLGDRASAHAWERRGRGWSGELLPLPSASVRTLGSALTTLTTKGDSMGTVEVRHHATVGEHRRTTALTASGLFAATCTPTGCEAVPATDANARYLRRLV
jgi:hypothetical protein